MDFSFKILFMSILLLCSCSDFFLSELDECGVPAGDNSSCLDECGVPNGNGISEGECDCDGNVVGCYGECGSNLVYDICGVCDGGELNEDNCACEDSFEEKDCLGECGGSAIEDECGICNGNNSFCTGCMIENSDNYSPIYTIPDNESCFVSYQSTIQPIFDNNCTGCHGSSGGLDLSSHQSVMVGGEHGSIIVLGNSGESILVQKLLPNPSFGDQMDYLNELMINKISLWIDLGALGN